MFMILYNDGVVLVCCLFVVYVKIVFCTVLQLIMYFMIERWERYKNIASLFFPLILLLNVIYDYVGTYDEMIIMDWGLVC